MNEDIGLKSQEEINNSIINMCNLYSSVNDTIRDQTVIFMKDLSEKWASGVAVDFANVYKERMDSVLRNWYQNFGSFLDSVKQKINAYAMTNESDIRTPGIDIVEAKVDVSAVQLKFIDGSEGMKAGFDVIELIQSMENMKDFLEWGINDNLQKCTSIFTSVTDLNNVEATIKNLVTDVSANIVEIENYAADRLNLSRENLEKIRSQGLYS